MTEQFKNLAVTLLDGGIDNSTTTVVVADGSVFPATGDFRIVIDTELMLCTARSSNTLTVTRAIESTSAASHSDEASVAHVITTASLVKAIQQNTEVVYDVTPQLGGDLDTNGHIITTASNAALVLKPDGTGPLQADSAGNTRGQYSVDLQRSRGAVGQVASGNYSVVVGGANGTASSDYSMVGGLSGVADHYGQVTQAAGTFAAVGDAQISKSVMRISTANGTPTEMFLDGSSSRLTLADQDCWFFDILVVARRQDADNEGAAFRFEGAIDRNGTVTASLGEVMKTIISLDSVNWDCNVTADDTNESLKITVTGEGSKTIRWVAKIELIEVNG